MLVCVQLSVLDENLAPAGGQSYQKAAIRRRSRGFASPTQAKWSSDACLFTLPTVMGMSTLQYSAIREEWGGSFHPTIPYAELT